MNSTYKAHLLSSMRRTQILAGFRQNALIVCAAVVSTTALMVGLVPSSNASLEVLSDMDCVVEPSATIDLGSAVPGLLAHSYYDRSDYVSVGTIMARLESDVERVALSIAEQAANSSTAIDLRTLTAGFGNRTRVRNAQLLKTSVISKQVMDQVSTEAKVANLQVSQEIESQKLAMLEVERARALLDRREIRSPINGTVVQKFKSAGEYVDSEPVYQIAQLDPLHIEVIVPIEYLGNLEAGMPATVSLDVPGFEGQQLNSVVRRVDSVADAASATYGVRLTLDNPDLTIPSGVRCQVDFFAS